MRTTDIDPDTLLTKAELAAVLRVSIDTVDAMARRRIGPVPLKVSPRRRAYRGRDVLAYLDQLQAQSVG
jgi:hypothetical protein